jgi:glycosyltransferase involved in cell wall biosynthesis
VSARTRVLHLIGDPGPYSYPFFSLLGTKIDRDRFEMEYGSVQRAGALQAEAHELGLPAFSLDANNRKQFPRAIARLTRHLLREKADVVHTHSLDASLIGLFAARVARRPVGLVSAHYSAETPLHNRLSLTAVDSLTVGRLARGVAAPSKQMRETLIETLHVPADKVRVIEHGIELDRFDPAHVDGGGVRSELGLDDHLVFGAVGRFFWMKNQHGLVQAFSALARDHPEAVLLLVGSGDPQPARQLAQELGIGAQVYALPFRENVPDLFAAMDVFVNPSLAESFGLVIVEAMAMAKPVLSTPVGIAPDLLGDGEAGMLVANGSPESLEAGLRDVLARRASWGEMGSTARQRAERFTVRRMVDEYERFYDDAVGGRLGT